MQNLSELIKKDNQDIVKELAEKHKYISQEYQDYGYRIALKLGDLPRKALYIKLAKEKPRALIEQAYSFAIDYPKAQNKGKIFMWKLKELVTEYNKQKGEYNNNETSKEIAKAKQKKGRRENTRNQKTKKHKNNTSEKGREEIVNKLNNDEDQLTLL